MPHLKSQISARIFRVSEITKLTLGELNLNPFELTAPSNSTGAIDRNGTTTLGYIKSETNLAVNPSIVQWNMAAANGNLCNSLRCFFNRIYSAYFSEDGREFQYAFFHACYFY
jgi:hypothetical protein